MPQPPAGTPTQWALQSCVFCARMSAEVWSYNETLLMRSRLRKDEPPNRDHEPFSVQDDSA